MKHKLLSKIKHYIWLIKHRVTSVFSNWWLNRQIRKHGVFVGKDEKYKTIQEALDANEKYIIIKGGPIKATTISKNKVHIIGRDRLLADRLKNGCKIKYAR